MGPAPSPAPQTPHAPSPPLFKAPPENSHPLPPAPLVPMLERIRVLIPLRRHLISPARSPDESDAGGPEPGLDCQPTSHDGCSDSGSGSEDITASAHARHILIRQHPCTSAAQAAHSTATLNRQKELLSYLAFPAPPSALSVPTHPSPLRAVLPPLPCPSRTAFGPLVLNSHWSGKQFSEEKSYSVNVNVIHLDLDHGKGSGVLDIVGLTEEWPTMTTFFDIEVIGPSHDFLTNAWHSSENCDYEHWSKFPSFDSYLGHRQATSSKRLDVDVPDDRLAVLRNSSWNPFRLTSGDESSGTVTGTSETESGKIKEWWFDQPFLFMRWKERFLVNDYKKQEIDGASFAGFYYVCLQLPQKPTDFKSDTPPPSPALRPEDPHVALEPEHTPDCPGSPSSSTGSSRLSRDEPFGRDSCPCARSGLPDEPLSSADERPRLDGAAPLDAPRGRRPTRVAGEEEKLHTLVAASGRADGQTALLAKPATESQRVAKPTTSVGLVVDQSLGPRGGGMENKFGWESARIQGFYYHPKSEPYQEMILQFDDCCFGKEIGIGDGDCGGRVDKGRSGFGSATYQIC